MDEIKINVGLYGDGSRNARRRAEVIYCDRCDICSLYKENKCARVTSFLTPCCPFGRTVKIDGGTKRSKAFDKVGDEARADECYGKLSYPYSRYVADFGDSVGVCVPYADAKYEDGQLKLDTLILNTSHWVVIPKEQFTTTILKQYYDYQAIGWNCSPIKKYRTEALPMFLRQVKQLFPDLYTEFIKIVPETKISPPNYVGKFAYLSTVNKDVSYEGFHFEGDELVNENWKSAFLPFSHAENAYVRIKVNDKMTVKITDNNQVTEETKFV